MFRNPEHLAEFRIAEQPGAFAVIRIVAAHPVEADMAFTVRRLCGSGAADRGCGADLNYVPDAGRRLIMMPMIFVSVRYRNQPGVGAVHAGERMHYPSLTHPHAKDVMIHFLLILGGSRNRGAKRREKIAVCVQPVGTHAGNTS